ncbi:MAG TPA: YIP1 family protein [Candidatus Binatia bacterium]|nr:YIP1 family protein [Candidatus Binatia bacterium]
MIRAVRVGGSSFVRRVLGALVLERATYREVAADPSTLETLAQAAAVTVAGGAAQTIGLAGLWDEGTGIDGSSLAVGAVASLLAWIVPTAILWWVALRLLRAPAPLPALLRAVGFAAAPGLLYVACAVLTRATEQTVLAWTIAAFAWLLSQGALYVAVQETLGTGTLRTLAAFAIAGVATAVVGLALAAALPDPLWQALVF